MIVAKNIHKKYEDLEILKGISLEVRKGEVVSIVGASGAGKTTLLHILGTLDQPDRGELHINNEVIGRNLAKNEIAAFRNEHIGFIFQFHHLLPEFTALENVCIPAYIGKKDKNKSQKRAMELLELLGLGARSDHKPSQLSGGEQQRVAVARALINNPAVVFADEPSGNLDSANARELHELFFKLRKDLEQTFVIVTHNEELAQMADRSLLIKDGKIEV
ncbi:MAG: ABC transporter ATP-binding protein [Bacteroidota bacterium]